MIKSSLIIFQLLSLGLLISATNLVKSYQPMAYTDTKAVPYEIYTTPKTNYQVYGNMHNNQQYPGAYSTQKPVYVPPQKYPNRRPNYLPTKMYVSTKPSNYQNQYMNQYYKSTHYPNEYKAQSPIYSTTKQQYVNNEYKPAYVQPDHHKMNPYVTPKVHHQNQYMNKEYKPVHHEKNIVYAEEHHNKVLYNEQYPKDHKYQQHMKEEYKPVYHQKESKESKESKEKKVVYGEEQYRKDNMNVLYKGKYSNDYKTMPPKKYSPEYNTQNYEQHHNVLYKDQHQKEYKPMYVPTTQQYVKNEYKPAYVQPDHHKMNPYVQPKEHNQYMKHDYKPVYQPIHQKTSPYTHIKEYHENSQYMNQEYKPVQHEKRKNEYEIKDYIDQYKTNAPVYSTEQYKTTTSKIYETLIKKKEMQSYERPKTESYENAKQYSSMAPHYPARPAEQSYEARCYSTEMKALSGDCQKFQVCASGVLTTMMCPDNLVFDDKLKMCNFKHNVYGQCGSRHHTY